jgi:hypothetical protein
VQPASKQEGNDCVAKFTWRSPELVAEMALPDFSTEFNLASLRANMDLAVGQKLVKPFDLEAMVWKP